MVSFFMVLNTFANLNDNASGIRARNNIILHRERLQIWDVTGKRACAREGLHAYLPFYLRYHILLQSSPTVLPSIVYCVAFLHHSSPVLPPPAYLFTLPGVRTLLPWCLVWLARDLRPKMRILIGMFCGALEARVLRYQHH